MLVPSAALLVPSLKEVQPDPSNTVLVGQILKQFINAAEGEAAHRPRKQQKLNSLSPIQGAGLSSYVSHNILVYHGGKWEKNKKNSSTVIYAMLFKNREIPAIITIVLPLITHRSSVPTSKTDSIQY